MLGRHRKTCRTSASQMALLKRQVRWDSLRFYSGYVASFKSADAQADAGFGEGHIDICLSQRS